MADRDPEMEELCDLIAAHAESVAALFKPGTVKVTVYVRATNLPDADVLVTPDDHDVMLGSLSRFLGRHQ